MFTPQGFRSIIANTKKYSYERSDKETNSLCVFVMKEHSIKCFHKAQNVKTFHESMCRNEVRRQGSFLLFNIDFTNENLIDNVLRARDEMKHLLVEKEMSS